MKKSVLRKVIKQLVKEQMNVDLPKLPFDKKNPGSPGPMNPSGNTNPNAMGANNQPGKAKFTVKDASLLYRSLGNPRNLDEYGQAFINKGYDANVVDKAIAGAMQKYGIGPNEPINPSAIPIWVWYVGRAILYGVGGYIITSEE